MPLRDLSLQTPNGSFSFVGRLHAGPSRASLFAMAGAFAPEGRMHELVDAVPGANVLVGRFHTISREPLEDLTVFHRALDQFVERMFGPSPVVAFGGSAGCLFTLGLKSPLVRRHVALEPFFSTAALWPFIQNARKRLALNPGDRGLAKFLWELFGVDAARVEERDYGGLLSGLAAPADVILGAEPLEPERATQAWPSFTSARDRARLAAHPMVTLHAGPPGSGHNLEGAPGGAELVRRLLVQALRAAGRPGP